MKITDNDYAALQDQVLPYMKGDTMRERWDALWESEGGRYNLQLKALYDAGLHDSHIDTALRRIQKDTANLETGQDGARRGSTAQGGAS